MAELVYAYDSESYSARIGSSSLPMPTMIRKGSLGLPARVIIAALEGDEKAGDRRVEAGSRVSPAGENL